MSEAFDHLPKEKQEKILAAALTEFTRHGYRKATTENIVRAAGIGKGMLFYYFGSKKELYLYLVEQTVSYVDGYFSRITDAPCGDLIEQFRLASKLKLEVYAKNPALMEFLGTLYLNPDDPALPADAVRRLKEIMQLRQETMTAIYSRVDTSLFRTDFPPEKLIRYIQWGLDGYMQFLLAEVKHQNFWEIDITDYFKKFDDYLDDLKKIYYK